MKNRAFIFDRTNSRLGVLMTVLAMSGCATAHAPVANSSTAPASPGIPGILSVTGTDLQHTGRIDTADALRILLPIFH